MEDLILKQWLALPTAYRVTVFATNVHIPESLLVQTLKAEGLLVLGEGRGKCTLKQSEEARAACDKARERKCSRLL